MKSLMLFYKKMAEKRSDAHNTRALIIHEVPDEILDENYFNHGREFFFWTRLIWLGNSWPGPTLDIIRSSLLKRNVGTCKRLFNWLKNSKQNQPHLSSSALSKPANSASPLSSYIYEVH